MPKPRRKVKVPDLFDDEVEEEFPGGVPEPRREETTTDKYVKAAGVIKGWGDAADVFDRIVSVSTVFPDFNRAVRVGGLPVRRIHTVHGPTHGGKTAFVLGLVKSFVDQGYLGGYVDAEYALGQEFVQEMVQDLRSKPNFKATRPKSYEETIASVDSFLAAARRVKKDHPESKSILVIDSINKLVPKRELEKILKAGEVNEKGAEELAKGHHGRYRAALNQAWLDRLTPAVHASDCAIVIIAQERDENDPTSFFDDFKVKGGAALLFDASIVMRVMKSSPVWLSASADKKNENIAGFGHRVRIWKSKVGHMQGRYSEAIFHLSNGKLTPPGLDTARDAFEVGRSIGIINEAGSWYTYRKKRIQGGNGVIKYLASNPQVLHGILGEISAKLDEIEGR